MFYRSSSLFSPHLCNTVDCLFLPYYWSNVLGIIYEYTCMNLYICIDLLRGFWRIIRHNIYDILFVIITLIWFIIFLDSLAIPLFFVLIVLEIQFIIPFIQFVHPTHHLIIFILNSLFMVISPPHPQLLSLLLPNFCIFRSQYYLWKFLISHTSLSPSHST